MSKMQPLKFDGSSDGRVSQLPPGEHSAHNDKHPVNNHVHNDIGNIGNTLTNGPSSSNQADSLTPDDNITGNPGYIPRKKSSFQITKVVKNQNDMNDSRDLDVTDDFEDGNTDEQSSDLLDSSHVTDGERGPSSADTIKSLIFETTSATKIQDIIAQVAAATPTKDTQSRFKIVKIESKDHSRRGRWVCVDFADPACSVPSSVNRSVSDGTAGATLTDQVYYIPSIEANSSKSPFANAIVYNQGQPMLERNPLESPMFTNRAQFFPDTTDFPQSIDNRNTLQRRGNDSTNGLEIAANGGNDVGVQQGGMVSPRTNEEFRSMLAKGSGFVSDPLLAMVSVMNSRTLATDDESNEQFERLSPSTEVLSSQLSCENVLIEEPAGFTGMGVDGLSSLFCSKFMESVASFFKMYMQEAYSGEYSSTGNVAIDNKIEQAMDLVKSHLMFAVREEVEILKEQIKELLAKNNQLEYENRVLREDATPETLAKLSSNQAL